MFYVSLEDAAKFWDHLEAELNDWEADTKLAEKLAERRQGRLALDSFSLEWQAQLDAKAIAIRDLRHSLETARSGEQTSYGKPLVIAMIDSALREALGNNRHGSSFDAANVVEGMAKGYKRGLLGNVFNFSFEEAGK